MEKRIVTYTYWLGIILMAVAFVWRILNAVGVQGSVMAADYMTFYRGAAILLLSAIATTGYVWVKSQKP